MTKAEIYNRILNDWASELNVNVSELGQNIKVDAAINAASEYRLSLIADNIIRNGWAGTADAEMLYIYGAGRLDRLPTGAIRGVWNCSTLLITGETDAIPDATEFRKGDYSYISVGETAAGATIKVRAVTAGTGSALVVGDELKSTSALKSISDTITVTEEVTTPVDAETIAQYRSDVVEDIKSNPSGGNTSDYILWASEVAGVRTVYPYAKNGEAGKGRIYVEGNNPIAAGSALIDSVILSFKYDSDGSDRAPFPIFPFLTTTNITAIQQTQVSVEIDGGDSSQQTTAETAIENYLYDIRPYLATLNETRDSSTDTIIQSAMIIALVSAGITFTDITITVNPLGGASEIITSYQVGNADYPEYYGEVPIFDTLTINE